MHNIYPLTESNVYFQRFTKFIVHVKGKDEWGKFGNECCEWLGVRRIDKVLEFKYNCVLVDKYLWGLNLIKSDE